MQWHSSKSEKAEQQYSIRGMANKTLAELYAKNPATRDAVAKAAGYAVFSDFGFKVIWLGGAGGSGLTVNNATKQETFMKMVEFQPGLGLGVNYSNEWAGKYYVQNASFTAAAVNPAVGYRITNRLSVGGGVSMVQGKLSERVAINTLLEPGDGRLKYDATDVGYGYHFGVLFELTSQTRVGVTHISQVNLDFKDELRFKNLNGTILEAALNASGLLDAQLKINVNIPAQLAVGAYHAFSDKLALVGTVNWQNWSRFGQPEISVADSNTVTDDLGYKDTYHAGIGVYYRVGDPWLLMAGFGYDTSPDLQQQRALTSPAPGCSLPLRSRRAVRLEQGFFDRCGLHLD